MPSPNARPPVSLSDRKSALLVCALLAAATLLVYWPVTEHGFLDWDDAAHVAANEHVNTGLTRANFIWAFQIHGPSQWHPLAWLSHQLDCSLFGLNARWHHATNLLLHTAAVLALFAALRRLTREVWPSAAVAALFALHPLGVESVTWIAERRDVLSALFFGLTLWAYAVYAERETAAGYLLTLALFALGLMSKPMLVTLPCVLLLLDYWPLRRIQWQTIKRVREVAQRDDSYAAASPRRPLRWLLLEKVPFLLLAVGSAYLSYLCQQAAGAVGSLQKYPLSDRLSNAVLNYVIYLGHMLWPWNLNPMYALRTSFDPWQVAAAAAVLLAITAAVIWQRRRPYLLVGWLWYLGMLVPVIGLLRLGVEVSMADRWVYLPMIGIYIAAVWGLRDLLLRSFGGQLAAAALATAALVACLIATPRQIAYWRDDATLSERVLQLDPDMPVAHNNLGNAMLNAGQYRQAVEHYSAALRAHSNIPDLHYNLGEALRRQGLLEPARDQFEQALGLNPDDLQVVYMLGVTLQGQGKMDEAIACYRKALPQYATDAAFHNTFGSALAQRGNKTEAIEHFQTAMRLNPKYGEAHFNLGNVLMNQQKFAEAIGEYQAAVVLRPNIAEFHFNLGHALEKAGRPGEAAARYTEALAIRPTYALAHRNLGVLLSKQGQPQKALTHFLKAVQLAPNDPMNHYMLGSALMDQEKPDSSETHFRAALRIKPDFIEARTGLAMALAKQGHEREAIAELHAVLKAQPDNSLAKEWLKQLESAAKKQP